MIAFALAIFLSAFLLFQVQPLMGKAILPLFGGGAGVWTACMLFFQAGLLGGYAYAHVITERLRPSRQVILHLVLLAASLLLLPVGSVDDSWRSESVSTPTVRILLLLLIKIGPPYVLLSATGPLLQHWFSRAFESKSPYRLYSLSNFGSLLALISYPFLFERVWTVKHQGWAWSGGFVAFVLLCAWCGRQFSQTAGDTTIQTEPVGDAKPKTKKSNTAANEQSASASPERDTPPTFGTMALWIALAAAGSLMLLSTTNQLCQDLTVVPMLWILPLAVYLITFIICFDHDRWYRRLLYVPLTAVSLVLINWMLHDIRSIPMRVQLVVYVVAMFAACMVCHGELVRSKPHPRFLTRFYLLIAAGGAVGGMIAAVLAPLLFADYWEYHLSWAMVSVLTVISLWRSNFSIMKQQHQQLAAMCSIVIALALSASLLLQIYNKSLVDVETSRSFYGVLHVQESPDHYRGPMRQLVHGQTVHGLQFLNTDRQDWPTAYYGHRSGVAIALRYLAQQREQEGNTDGLRIGVIGLGAGTIATYARPNDTVRFYEINEDVGRIAREQFTYLDRCRGKTEVVIGDARVVLDKERRADTFPKFDLLAIDAFSSDAIPLHLITQEAFDIYHDHLKPDGIIAFHISNNFLDLYPVVRGIAGSRQYQVRTIQSKGDAVLLGTKRARWALATRNGDVWDFEQFKLSANAKVNPLQPNLPWTDDSANLISVMITGDKEPGLWDQTPNGGTFVIDAADALKSDTLESIFWRLRKFYLQTKSNMPLMVVTTDQVPLDIHGKPQVTPNGLAEALYRDHFKSAPMGIMVVIIMDQKRAAVHFGNRWDRATRPHVVSRLKPMLSIAHRSDTTAADILGSIDALQRFLETNYKAELSAVMFR